METTHQEFIRLVTWSIIYAIVALLITVLVGGTETFLSSFTGIMHDRGPDPSKDLVHNSNVILCIFFLSINEAAVLCGYLCAKKVMRLKLLAGLLPMLYWIPILFSMPLQQHESHLPVSFIYAARLAILPLGLLGAFLEAKRFSRLTQKI